MIKKMIFPIAMIMVCVLLGGCFNANNPPEATPVPEIMASPSPGVDGVAGATSAPGVGGAAAAFNWQTQAAAVEARVNMFSEIEDNRVIADGDTALVGIRFSSAYQGELTQRIRDMIAGEVKAADNAIQVVAVTAEENDVRKIFELSDMQRAGNAPADFKQQIDQIARNTTTLR